MKREKRWTCLDIRNDKFPPCTSRWMELEGIMLSEVSQSEKDKHCMLFIWGIQIIVKGI